MVERQYDILKKERGKGPDDTKTKSEENGIPETHIHENGSSSKPEVNLAAVFTFDSISFHHISYLIFI